MTDSLPRLRRWWRVVHVDGAEWSAAGVVDLDDAEAEALIQAVARRGVPVPLDLVPVRVLDALEVPHVAA